MMREKSIQKMAEDHLVNFYYANDVRKITTLNHINYALAFNVDNVIGKRSILRNHEISKFSTTYFGQCYLSNHF